MKWTHVPRCLVALGVASSGFSQTGRFHGDILDVRLVLGIRQYCHLVQFPGGWRYKPTTDSGQPRLFSEHANYEFRVEGALGTWFLVGGFEKFTERYDAPIHFRINLSDATAPVSPASLQEWDHAAVVPLTRKSVFRAWPEPLSTDPAKFNGLLFAKTGRQWAAPSEEGSRLSPDSLWLVLQSETHRKKFPDEHHESSVYWDVFNAETGEKLNTVEGTYSGWFNDPSFALARAAWLTERYFIIPLGEHIERCLVCEFAKGTRQGAKP